MATVFSQVAIGAADRKASVLRVELWRTVNAVGNWTATLRNTSGVFNGVFDVQDQFLIDVDGAGNTLMQGRVDGPAVTLRGKDLESDWDEYVVVRGVDQAQDLLFHNDFDNSYPDAETAAQQVKTVWNDVINVQLGAATNITYVPPVGATPAVGSVEFKEGTNFLSTTQDLFRRAGFIFYVDDALAFQSGAPGFNASGVILRSIADDVTNNIIDVVDLTERDGGKHYNLIKLYGKNPMFDGYTEFNLPSWTFIPAGQGLDNTANVKVGTYSQVAFNNNPVNVDTRHIYTLPQHNYTTFDFSKGTLGVWAYYDNNAGAPGAPGAGTRRSGAPGALTNVYLFCRLTDNAARTADFFGDTTRCFVDNWCWCNFPIGQHGNTVVGNVANQWFLSNVAFDWSNITAMYFELEEGVASTGFESHLYLDGLTIPEPVIAIAQNAGAQAAYRTRPYVDYWQHINTQNAIDEAATQFLAQHESTSINRVKIITPGNLALRYAGQSVTVNIPSMGLNSTVMYMTKIHHVIEPYHDVSGGFGFDWITEIEAVPTSGVAYDMGRLREGSARSSNQLATRGGTGLRIK